MWDHGGNFRFPSQWMRSQFFVFFFEITFSYYHMFIQRSNTTFPSSFSLFSSTFPPHHICNSPFIFWLFSRQWLHRLVTTLLTITFVNVFGKSVLPVMDSHIVWILPTIPIESNIFFVHHSSIFHSSTENEPKNKQGGIGRKRTRTCGVGKRKHRPEMNANKKSAKLNALHSWSCST